MPTTREQLRRWMAERKRAEKAPAWTELMDALGLLEREARARGMLEREDMDLLAALLARPDSAPTSDPVPVPHTMAPEELVQWRALRVLEVAGGLGAVRECLERLGRSATAPALRGLARRLISQLGKGGAE